MKAPDDSVKLVSFFTIMTEELNGKLAEGRSFKPALERQVLRARKRASFHNADLPVRAVDGFKAVNKSVSEALLRLTSQEVRDASYFILRTLENVTTSYDEGEIQNPLSASLLFSLWGYGKGSSNGVPPGSKHPADKIYEPMTCTPPSESLVSKLRSLNHYFQLYDERNGNSGTKLVQGSRLSTVPKNEETDRTIAIEPSGNMALQLAAGSYLSLGLRSIGIDIQDQQPINKALAKRGSIDGSVATIDLKSASDMYSVPLVRALLPSPWFNLLMAIRSETIKYPDGSSERLHMMSTMGNGFTFPLMTLINCSLIYAYRCSRGGPNCYIDWTSSAVYGDDIIVPTDEYDACCDIIERAGLIVNHDKSYCAGPFRESCGGDYYEGVDITPFYVRSLSTDSQVYVVINQVLAWCARHNVFLHRTMTYLKTTITGSVFLIPEWRNPDQGVLTALVPKRYKYLKPALPQSSLEREDFKVMLAIGGYISSLGSDSVYTPRQHKTRYVVAKSRLPTGYLDGSDPLSRSDLTTLRVATYVAFLFPDLTTLVMGR